MTDHTSTTSPVISWLILATMVTLAIAIAVTLGGGLDIARV